MYEKSSDAVWKERNSSRTRMGEKNMILKNERKRKRIKTVACRGPCLGRCLEKTAVSRTGLIEGREVPCKKVCEKAKDRARVKRTDQKTPGLDFLSTHFQVAGHLAFEDTSVKTFH
ncbi:hypothetical protein TWF173_004996 [Orbilia oligospora]|nr:hypothetical protein TWF173_004996 [Orbilia oligospora]